MKVEKINPEPSFRIELTETEARHLMGVLMAGPKWDDAPWAEELHDALGALGLENIDYTRPKGSSYLVPA
jgi:hypothetical protein